MGYLTRIAESGNITTTRTNYLILNSLTASDIRRLAKKQKKSPARRRQQTDRLGNLNLVSAQISC